MELKLIRKWRKETYTIGQLYINSIFFGNTLEDKDRGLSDNMSETVIKTKKVYGETAIPTGRYSILLTYSNKFHSRAWAQKYNGKVPLINSVKGFSGIRIHPLNTAKDSYGCIGVGENDKAGWISNSTKYFYDLMDKYIVPALKNGEKIYITISHE